MRHGFLSRVRRGSLSRVRRGCLSRVNPSGEGLAAQRAAAPAGPWLSATESSRPEAHDETTIAASLRDRFVCFAPGLAVNAGEKMHRRAGVKMHQG
jgi:hypothetical protein